MTGIMSFSIGILVFISLFLSLLDSSILLKCDIQIKAHVSKNKGKQQQQQQQRNPSSVRSGRLQPQASM